VSVGFACVVSLCRCLLAFRELVMTLRGSCECSQEHAQVMPAPGPQGHPKPGQGRAGCGGRGAVAWGRAVGFGVQ